MPCNCGHPERGICCGEKEEICIDDLAILAFKNVELQDKVRFQKAVMDQYLKEIKFLEAKVAFLEAQIRMRTSTGTYTSPLTLP